MENYGNSAVKVLWMFHAFLRWKDNVYRQLFCVTNCDKLPNLLFCDACYTLGVLKPCYTLWKNSLDLVRVPQILLSHKRHPSMHQKRMNVQLIHFFIRNERKL